MRVGPRGLTCKSSFNVWQVSRVTPILWSFRRCPYAIRARLAIAVAETPVILREVVLRDKPEAFLAASPSASVPCLEADGGVIDESLDIMVWALSQRDPEAWLEMPGAGWDWITRIDGPFKHALDRAKYATRYPGVDPEAQWCAAADIVGELDTALEDWLFAHPTLADYAMLPFLRQFAFIDKQRFDAQPWPRVHAWLERFLTSPRFAAIMEKYPKWVPRQAQIGFPGARAP